MSQELDNFLNKGQEYHLIGDHEKALIENEKAVNIAPENPDALVARARSLHLLNRNLEEALSDCTKAISINPMNSWAFNIRGLIYRSLKNEEKAFADFTRAFEISPNYPDAYCNRGYILYNQRKYHEALNDFTLAIQYNNKHFNAYQYRSLVFYKLGEYEKSIEDANIALSINSTVADVYINRSWDYKMLNNFDAALEDCNSAINVNPKSSWAYNTRGLIFFDTNRLDEALDDFNKAILLHASYADPIYNKGRIYQKKMEHQKAIQEFSKAIKLDSNKSEAYFEKGTSHFSINELDEALAEFNKAWERREYMFDKGMKITLVALDVLNKKWEKEGKHDIEEVIKWSERPFEVDLPEFNDPNSPFYYIKKAVETNNYNSAILFFNKAIELDPTFPMPYALRSLYYLNNKDYGKAIEDQSTLWDLDKEDSPGKLLVAGGVLEIILVQKKETGDFSFENATKWLERAETYYNSFPEIFRSFFDEVRKILRSTNIRDLIEENE